MSQTVPANERLSALTAAGTSAWLDQIRRDLLTDGELGRMAQAYSLRGVTSNPAIFEKAILGSDDYDGQIRSLARDGADAHAIYEAIALQDVRDACDVLGPVHAASGGADGFVSLEVDPGLAHDADGTIVQARAYWEALDRPNAMIKIPGTDACVPAIEQAIYEGINVNVTLLFSVAAYERVADAYLRGLERRHAEGLPLDVHSVASFFVSRVDTEVDRRLRERGREDLAGRAGLANARAAYHRFRALFDGDRFAPLRAAGAAVQRPLWASTGVKDPAYPDTLYVDGLVGPDTVNTMPLATLEAAAERSDPAAFAVDGTPTAALDPSADLAALAEAGIDLDDVTDTLLREGIAAFVTPMEQLLAGIEEARAAAAADPVPAVGGQLPDALAQAVEERVAQAVEADVIARIWAIDDTVFGPAGQPEVADRLGWLTIADRLTDEIGELVGFARSVRDDGIEHVVLLGMGGSSLAPEVVRRSFGDQAGWPALLMLDSTDATAVRRVQDAVDLRRTLFVVSTKSGGTIETLSAFEHFHAVMYDTVGAEAAGRHFVAITDPGSSLVDLAAARGFRRTFLNDPDIGGRYSALSYFGLVPAALMGADLPALLDGASAAARDCRATPPAPGGGGWLGCAIGELARHGRDKLTFVVDPPLEAFGLWVEQLIAESTGKEGRGILPVADEPLGATDAYGPDRVLVHLRADGGDGAHDGRLAALAAAGHPVLTMPVHGPGDLGRIFLLWEFATAVAGWALGINPFDQPNVAEAKEATKAVLADGLDGAPEADADDAALGALLAGLRDQDGGYLAIMGYLEPSAAFDDAVAELRATVRDATARTTTFGYGPRFLHSTGQFHKGGPAVGSFLQLVHDRGEDVAIPGQTFGFTTLKHAQALGDLRTLRAHGRPAERLTLEGDDPVAALRAVTARLKELL
ncbi:bifunctional transaldolase/phosoglucose isomerase [Paraconexibacter algicola]|uniref:Transaldolase n=1 Tax=Paraconexibacter algicola TaxID=2133960 RepID=A0A2T4UMH9_9ACTN|nr:bifunctional transaldolase/phosoglucose isomerase [Paraconexibacter algicola]PTL60457.1 transaldolase [Paraconexibacter algicola]